MHRDVRKVAIKEAASNKSTSIYFSTSKVASQEHTIYEARILDRTFEKANIAKRAMLKVTTFYRAVIKSLAAEDLIGGALRFLQSGLFTSEGIGPSVHFGHIAR